jgi:creatinine amidohydrolase
VSGRLELAELTRGSLAESAPGAVLVVPFGAVEQHGPDLPFGTDLMIVDAVSRAAVERSDAPSTLVLAPPVAYGSSHHHLDVGGAFSLGPAAFGACAHDLLASAAASGFRRVFALNGHGGNEQLLRVAAAQVAREQRLEVGGGSYWEIAADVLSGATAHVPVVPGHAGRFEASLVLALRPGWTVAAGRHEGAAPPPVPPYWHEDPERWRAIDGYTDEPGEATVADGAAWLELVVDAVAAALGAFDRATGARDRR